VIVLSKSMMVRFLGVLFLLSCGLPFVSVSAQSHEAHRSAVPKACYFLAPHKEDESANRARREELAEERAYDMSVGDVYRKWCTPSHSSPSERKAAVDTMVKRWKAIWDRDDPFDAEFHETAASDLLEIMGLTHELPAQMVRDPEFTKRWAEDCAEHCFTIWGVPENSTEEHGLAMRLWLRNELLDHLKKEPASEPVLDMLENAEYRLVD